MLNPFESAAGPNRIQQHSALKAGLVNSPAIEPSDLAIKLPDFYIAAIGKPARSLECLGVRIGFDGLAGPDTVVVIDQIGTVGWHDTLPSRRQRPGNKLCIEAALRELNGTNLHCAQNRTETVELWSPGETKINQGVVDDGSGYRRLARQADPFTQKRLLDLAAEYDARIKLLEPQPSAASRILRGGDF
jgi:hypothetical protein